MDTIKNQNAPVLLKGINYLLWARTLKIFLGGKGLWNHVVKTKDEVSKISKKALIEGAKEGQGDKQESVILDEEDDKWFQEDQMVLGYMQGSLEPSLLEAYSYCETTKELLDTLKNVFGNVSNLSRVFEVKKAINELKQEDMEFNNYFGKFRALWAEMEMLRPFTLEASVLKERSEQDKVFALLFNLNSGYKDLIKHILRSDKLGSLEEVCSQIQKEQGTLGLFGGRRELALANKGVYNQKERRQLYCEHCKKDSHTKDKCWLLHPHLKPQKFNERSGPSNGPRPRFNNNNFRANNAQEGQPRYKEEGMEVGNSSQGDLNKSLAMVSYHPSRETVAKEEVLSDYVKKADLDALVKALKDATKSGNLIGNGIGESLLAKNVVNSLILDSGASHHMISNLDLIDKLEPTLGDVIIANGDRIPIKGIGKLKLFDKESSAFYMPSFTSNLLSIKRITNDLNCNVIFRPNDVVFQDIESNGVLGMGETKGGLYVLEDTKLNSHPSILSNVFNFNVVHETSSLWHARLGHPHSRALELMLPNFQLKKMMNVRLVSLANIVEPFFLSPLLFMKNALT